MAHPPAAIPALSAHSSLFLKILGIIIFERPSQCHVTLRSVAGSILIVVGCTGVILEPYQVKGSDWKKKKTILKEIQRHLRGYPTSFLNGHLLVKIVNCVSFVSLVFQNFCRKNIRQIDEFLRLL